jgi:hypothetical protein
MLNLFYFLPEKLFCYVLFFQVIDFCDFSVLISTGIYRNSVSSLIRRQICFCLVLQLSLEYNSDLWDSSIWKASASFKNQIVSAGKNSM